MNNNTKTILKGLAIGFGIVGIAVGISIYRKRNKGSKGNSLSIIIGDSQTPFIATQSNSVSLLGKTGGENNLWLSGMGLKWLKGAVSKYPVNTNVGNVVINIGTNDGFNSSSDVKGLVSEIKRVFPSAKLYVVQGSWGWGNNKNITSEMVKAYYDKFKAEGVKVINPPIGSVTDPHSNLPIYKEIGKSIDSLI